MPECNISCTRSRFLQNTAQSMLEGQFSGCTNLDLCVKLSWQVLHSLTRVQFLMNEVASLSKLFLTDAAHIRHMAKKQSLMINQVTSLSKAFPTRAAHIQPLTIAKINHAGTLCKALLTGATHTASHQSNQSGTVCKALLTGATNTASHQRTISREPSPFFQ